MFSQDEENPGHATTTIPPTSRYELIQSNIAAKATFKIDKYSGDTYVMRKESEEEDSGYVWVFIEKEESTKDIITSKSKVNYQLFTSGLAVRYTFLMNIETGFTWQLVVTEEGEYKWQTM